MSDQDLARIRLSVSQIDCLSQIVRADAKQNPVWDGQIIGSQVGRDLQEMGLVHHSYGYWMPTPAGKGVWRKIKKLVQNKEGT